MPFQVYRQEKCGFRLVVIWRGWISLFAECTTKDQSQWSFVWRGRPFRLTGNKRTVMSFCALVCYMSEVNRPKRKNMFCWPLGTGFDVYSWGQELGPLIVFLVMVGRTTPIPSKLVVLTCSVGVSLLHSDVASCHHTCRPSSECCFILQQRCHFALGFKPRQEQGMRSDRLRLLEDRFHSCLVGLRRTSKFFWGRGSLFGGMSR